MELTKCKLGELITQRREKNDGSDLPICGVSKDGLIPPKQKDADTSIYNVFYRDDFIFNPARMELNSIAINDMYDRAICSSLYEVFYVHRTDLLLPHYLKLIIRQKWFTRYCEFLGQGSAREYCRFGNISEIEIEFPPIEEQQKIVDYNTAIENRIALKQKINDNLFATANAFFTEKFSHFLHEDMRNMPNYVQLKNFVKIKHGYAFDGEQFSETKTSKILVSPGNFKIGGGFQNNKPKFYNEKAEYKTDYILEPGSLVVTMTDLSKNGDTLGFPAIIPNDKQITFLHNQRVGLVELVNNIYPKAFIYFLMCSNDYRNYILATASGTTVRHTSPDKILGYGFLAPDNKSDLMLLNRLYEVYLSDCDTLNIEIQRLTELQATLLSKMVY
jgi:restriction endonuclease S subunit